MCTKALRDVVGIMVEDHKVIASSTAVNRSSVASLACLVWDILITFDEEVRVIWPNNSCWHKALYFFVRYIALIVQISMLFIGTELSHMFNFTSRDCLIFQAWQGVGAFLVISATDLILILRVHALYYGNAFIRVSLVLLFVAEMVVMLTGLGFAIPQIEYDHICRVTRNPPIFMALAGAPITFQTILFLLTGYKFIQAARDGWGDVPLMMLLMRDGIWAFFLLFVILLSEASLYGAGADGYAGVLFGWLLTSFSLAGYRVLLNIHHMSHSNQPSRTSTRSSSTHNPYSIHLTSHFTEDLSNDSDTPRCTTVTHSIEHDAPLDYRNMIPLTQIIRSRSVAANLLSPPKPLPTRTINFVEPGPSLSRHIVPNPCQLKKSKHPGTSIHHAPFAIDLESADKQGGHSVSSSTAGKMDESVEDGGKQRLEDRIGGALGVS